MTVEFWGSHTHTLLEPGDNGAINCACRLIGNGRAGSCVFFLNFVVDAVFHPFVLPFLFPLFWIPLRTVRCTLHYISDTYCTMQDGGFDFHGTVANEE